MEQTQVEWVGVVGASGAVGKEMIRLLDERNFPTKGLKLFAKRAAGNKVETKNFGEIVIEPFTVEAAQECDIVLLAVSGTFALEYAPLIVASKKGTTVIDNSSAFRYDAGIPLVIPEINGHLAAGASLIANPNCTTAVGAMALWPIHQKYRLKKVLMSTYQASSGAGAEGMLELEDAVKAYAKTGEVPAPKVFQHQLAFNVIPQIDAFQPNGYTKEEMKVAWEMQKIFDLKDTVKISCTAVRVPTFRAHSEVIVVETERPINASDCQDLLDTAPGVQVVDDPDSLIYPMPINAAGKNDVEVGRIRQSLVFGEHGLEMFVSGDQLLRGAALNAVLIAETCMASRAHQTEFHTSTMPLFGSTPWAVHKFGGAALADAQAFKLCGDQLVEEGGESGDWRPVAGVVSAAYGVTDKLIAVMDAAKQKNGIDKALQMLAAATETQIAIAEELLNGHPNLILDVVSLVTDSASNITVLVKGVALLGCMSNQTIEYVAGLGEVWSAKTLTAYLHSQDVAALMMDAREVLIVESKSTTLGEKGAAVDLQMEPLYERSAIQMSAWWQKESGKVESDHQPIIIITGFVATDVDGLPTTLKRSGSDFSATIFGALLKANTVTLWKNITGVYTADPRKIPAAVTVPSISYSEAVELAYFGGEVLHPSAMRPCIDNNIEILVRNIHAPLALGTSISSEESADQRGIESPRKRISQSEAEGSVKLLTSMNNIALVRIKAGSWGSVTHVCQRATEALSNAEVKVILITQASSEHSLSLAVDERAEHDALVALKNVFELELIRGDIRSIVASSGYSIVSIIGPMMGKVGTLASFTGGLARGNVNIIALAQGSSERSISVVIAQPSTPSALKSLHRTFFEDKEDKVE